MSEEDIRIGQGERLTALRRAAGFRSGRAASSQFEWPESTYSAHEAGRRTIGLDDAEKYASKLGLGSAVWIMFGRPEDEPKNLPVPVKSPRSRPAVASNISAPFSAPELSKRKIPVYGVAVGGDDGRMKFNGERLDMVGCPPQLEDVRDAYAVYVAGDSMHPSFKSGHIAWVNPHLTAKTGDDVIVQLHAEDGEAPEGFIKELVRRTSSVLVVKQYNPAMEIKFAANEVLSVHVVVFSTRR